MLKFLNDIKKILKLIIFIITSCIFIHNFFNNFFNKEENNTNEKYIKTINKKTKRNVSESKKKKKLLQNKLGNVIYVKIY